MALRLPWLVACLLLVVAGCKDATLEPDLVGDIAGTVVDYDTGGPVAGASVTTSPPTGALVTDADGRFALDGVDAGNYTITASKAGYKTNAVTVAVQENRVTPATLFLRADDAGDTAAALDVEIANWASRVSNDSVFVGVEYRVVNTGAVAIPAYEVYFRIDAEPNDFYEEVQGENLGSGQTDIGRFEKYVGTSTPLDVVVDDLWFDGQDG